MKELFFIGGVGFMSILTILLIALVAWSVYHIVLALNKRDTLSESFERRLSFIKSIGLFAMITGILGQLIGLYMAFSAIEKAADISPAIVFGGVKVSMVPTLYGIIIYLLSIIIWFILNLILLKRLKT